MFQHEMSSTIKHSLQIVFSVIPAVDLKGTQFFCFKGVKVKKIFEEFFDFCSEEQNTAIERKYFSDALLVYFTII